MAGLYIHIPFCTQRCVYCDFYFVTTRSSHDAFVDALSAEMDHVAERYGTSEPVETIYFGGGTPSLLSLKEVERILDEVHGHFDTEPLQELTFELNPEDVDLEYLRGLRRLGIDRLSIGIQSFFEEDLSFMGRSHSPQEADAIVPMARRAGFDNFSTDLIFGLPDQPEERWKANLQRMASLEVPHLSTYGLTIEKRTPLGNRVERGLVEPTGDETMRRRYQHTMDFLRKHGYEHYEISSFARADSRAQHNQRYWQHDNYIGLGPSAHSFWWTDDEPAHRWSNVGNLRRYEERADREALPRQNEETLSLPELADEHVMLRLRTSDGLDLNRMASRYKTDLAARRGTTIDRLIDQGLLQKQGPRIRLTDAGKHVCDSVTAELLP